MSFPGSKVLHLVVNLWHLFANVMIWFSLMSKMGSSIWTTINTIYYLTCIVATIGLQIYCVKLIWGFTHYRFIAKMQLVRILNVVLIIDTQIENSDKTTNRYIKRRKRKIKCITKSNHCCCWKFRRHCYYLCLLQILYWFFGYVISETL